MKKLIIIAVAAIAPTFAYARPVIRTCVWPNVCMAQTVARGPVVTTCVWPHPCSR